jgi:hypothetical protein
MIIILAHVVLVLVFAMDGKLATYCHTTLSSTIALHCVLHGCLRCMHSLELSLHGLHEVGASMTEGEVISLGKFSMLQMVL